MESRAELDLGYGRRGCFMAVAVRLAGGCLWEALSLVFFITCILGVFSAEHVSFSLASQKYAETTQKHQRTQINTYLLHTYTCVTMRATSHVPQGPHRGPGFSSGRTGRRLNAGQAFMSCGPTLFFSKYVWKG